MSTATFTHTTAADINTLIAPASIAAVRQPLTGESMIVYASPEPDDDDETEPQTMHLYFDNAAKRDSVLRLILRMAQEMRGEEG